MIGHRNSLLGGSILHSPTTGAHGLAQPGSNPQNDGKPASGLSEALPKNPAPFSLISCQQSGRSDWQVEHLIKKKGVNLLVVPPGACSFALCAYFAALLSGKAGRPFGEARYPGTVFVSTYTQKVAEALESSIPTFYPSNKNVYAQLTTRRFNWRMPMISLAEVAAGLRSGEAAAIIIDTGTFPQGVNEAIVESTYAALNELADRTDCAVLLVVESTSRSKDPFERVPRNLRACRGTLLAVPVLSKGAGSRPWAPSQFMLVSLVDTAPSALMVRFRLEALPSLPGTSIINWGNVNFGDPRAAFMAAETADLTSAQEAALQLAINIISSKGATSAAELVAAAKFHGVAPTTMRDTLSIGKLLGQLTTFRLPNGRWLWCLPVIQEV